MILPINMGIWCVCVCACSIFGHTRTVFRVLMLISISRHLACLCLVNVSFYNIVQLLWFEQRHPKIECTQLCWVWERVAQPCTSRGTFCMSNLPGLCSKIFRARLSEQTPNDNLCPWRRSWWSWNLSNMALKLMSLEQLGRGERWVLSLHDQA